MAWTDDALREAINTVKPGINLGLRTVDFHTGEPYHFLETLRQVLTALGIDHQPKPKLPTEVGSMIYDAVVGGGDAQCAVMTLNRFNYWIGVGALGAVVESPGERITSFGGVLDLEKVRGEQGE